MKTKNYVLFVFFVFTALIFTSCGKDGATGPQGPAGATGASGAAGATGPTGPAGTNGSVIYSGNTTPSAATGAVGDFYLDLGTGVLYGPKTAGGWGSGFSLKGPAGAAGAAGNTIISGTGIPSAATGKTGDYYLDDSSYMLYGPKTAGGWGTATSLQGPAGTANVQYSGWNYATNQRDTTIDGSSLVIMTLAAPSITAAELNNSSIQVYCDFGAGVFPLPYTSFAGGKENTINYLPQVGRFIITRFTADNSASISLSTLIQYRYVIIPGSVALAVGNHINLKNYEAVRKYFRIPD
jgi:hypothetical protein